MRGRQPFSHTVPNRCTVCIVASRSVASFLGTPQPTQKPIDNPATVEVQNNQGYSQAKVNKPQFKIRTRELNQTSLQQLRVKV